MSDELAQVRELHKPVDDEPRLVCVGCDMDGYEVEPPLWPCRTAEIVYSADEIAAATSANR